MLYLCLATVSMLCRPTGLRILPRCRGYLARIRHGKQQLRSTLLAVRWGKVGSNNQLAGREESMHDHAAATIQRYYR